jgi:hypothetical protein
MALIRGQFDGVCPKRFVRQNPVSFKDAEAILKLSIGVTLFRGIRPSIARVLGKTFAETRR